MHQRDYVRAGALQEQSLALFRARGNTWEAAFVLMRMGHVASAQGEHPRASQLYEESLLLFRTLGYPGDNAWPLLLLAREAISQEEHTRARSWLAKGLAH